MDNNKIDIATKYQVVLNKRKRTDRIILWKKLNYHRLQTVGSRSLNATFFLSILYLYFVIHTKWYLISYTVWLLLLYSAISTVPPNAVFYHNIYWKEMPLKLDRLKGGGLNLALGNSKSWYLKSYQLNRIKKDR